MTLRPGGESDEDDPKYGGFRPAGDSDFESDCSDYDGYLMDPLPKHRKNFAYRKPELDPREEFYNNVTTLIASGDLQGIKDAFSNCKINFNIDDYNINNWNLLFHACFSRYPEIVKYLINEKYAKVNKLMESTTPLMIACNSDQDSDVVFEIVEFLISNNAALNVKDLFGKTPLMFAAAKGHFKVVKLFVDMRASLNCQDNFGYTALLFAVEGNFKEVAEVLIKAGCNLELSNRRGFDAKSYAIHRDATEILALFPVEEPKYLVPLNYLNYDTYLDLVPGLSKNTTNEVPSYFPDITDLLYGMKCDDLVNVFGESKIGLHEFLTIDEEKLKEVGVKYSFKRQLILQGLLKFHEKKWTKQSMGLFKLDDQIDTLDFYYICAGILRHLVVLKSTLTYQKVLQRNSKFEFNTEALNELDRSLKELDKEIVKMKKEIVKISAKNPKKNPLLIEYNVPQKWKFPKVLKIACGIMAVPLLVYGCFQIKKLWK